MNYITQVRKQVEQAIAFRMVNRLLLSIFILIWVVCLSLIFATLPVRAEPIKIGMSAAFKGPSGALGNELYRGTMAYLKLINNQGGVDERQIVIKAYDDGYNPLPAIKNTIQLIEFDRVFLLMNYVGTPTVTAVLPLLKKYEGEDIFLFFPFTGAQPQRQPPYKEFVFNLRASYQQETAGLVNHFLQLGRKRIAIFYQIDAYGRRGGDGVRTGVREHGLSIVAEATYRRGTEYTASFKPQVEILRKTNPDAIISVGSYEACAGFIRDARDAGWQVPIANVSFVGSESLLNLLLETGKKLKRDYTKNLINSQVVPSYQDLSLPAVREYRKAMAAYEGTFPHVEDKHTPFAYSFVSFEGFLNAKLLVEILKRLPTPLNRANLLTTIENLPPLDIGLDIPIKFSVESHQGLNQVYYTTVEGEQFVPITSWQNWAKK